MYKIYLYKYLYKYIKKTQIEREEIYIYRNINIILYIKKNKEGNYLWENGSNTRRDATEADYFGLWSEPVVGKSILRGVGFQKGNYII